MTLNLEALNMMTLVAIHNSISDKPAAMKTFSQRSKAVARIEKIAAEKGIDLSERFEADGQVKVTKTVDLMPADTKEETTPANGLSSTLAQLGSAGKATAKPKADKPANGLSSMLAQLGSAGKATAKPKADKPAAKRAEKAENKEKGPVIRVVAEALLLEVITHDEDGRPYGHPYDVILNKIHEQFPESKTSVACLRWYAVHMRERDERVPNRRRAVAKKAAE